MTGADMASMGPVLKESYTPEQRALAELAKPKPQPKRQVSEHIKRVSKEDSDGSSR